MMEELFLISTKIVLVLVFLIVPILLYYRDKKRLTTYLISISFVLAITYGLKYAFAIPRPEEAAWEMVTPRFPSGHTSMAFTPILFFKSLRYKIPLLAYALVVAYSRLYFNLHVIIDIIVSVGIAFLISLFFLRFEKGINQKLNALIDSI